MEVWTFSDMRTDLEEQSMETEPKELVPSSVVFGFRASDVNQEQIICRVESFKRAEKAEPCWFILLEARSLSGSAVWF